MIDIGWTELLLIGIVALIVVGPRDLPKMFRALGQFTAKARGMAREFQRAMESAADESGVKDLKRDFRDMASGKGMGLDDVENSIGAGLDPGKAARDAKTRKAKTAGKAASAKSDGTPPDASAHGPETAALAERQKADRTRRKADAEARATPAPTDDAPAAGTDDGAAAAEAGDQAAGDRRG